MARRKTGFVEDGMSDSDASASGSEGSKQGDDADAEFRVGTKRKRPSGGGKADAWEGIFAEGGEEQSHRGGRGGRGGRGRGGRGGGGSGRNDWTKAPSFVSKSSAAVPEPEIDPAFDIPEVVPATNKTAVSDSGSDMDTSGSESDSDAPREPRSPRIREDEEDDIPAPRAMGMGGFKAAVAAAAGTNTATSTDSTPGTPAEERHVGLGAHPKKSRGGIGSSARSAASSFTAPAPIPTAFGRPQASAAAETSASAGNAFSRPKPPPPTVNAVASDLRPEDHAHFRKIGNSFGAKMLEKMGWQAGKGLGADESGRAVPIQVGKLMRGQGIAAGVRTEDSKREARKRGEVFSDDEEDKPKRGGRKQKGKQQQQEAPDQSWKQQRKVKVKVEHKTYEQLLAEAGESAAPGIGLVLDARGGELKEIHSLSSLSLSTWTPTSDKTKLPELRHNLRLIADLAKTDVDNIAREAVGVNSRRQWALREEEATRARMAENERQMNKLAKVQTLVESIVSLAKQQASNAEPSIAPLAESFHELLNKFGDEYINLDLDDVIVGALAQVLRRPLAHFEPFDLSGSVLLAELKAWKKAYNMQEDSAGDEPGRTMSPWESLLWTSWMPKVRSAINNEWDPTDPNPAVHLLESWNPILPAFIRDNILDQLILPKVKKAVESWDPKRSKVGSVRVSLAGIVFPWLPMLGDRVDEVLGDAKRRIKSVMRTWAVKDAPPAELARWKKDIYSSSEWDKLVLQYLLPKLAVTLREDFSVNPRNQEMVPLEQWVFPWRHLVRPSMFAQLLEAEFFPKWLEILYIWLIQPNFSADEVATWYDFWKNRFPADVLEIKGVAYGFNKGLQLMQTAMELGADAPVKLRKPDTTPMPASSEKESKPVAAKKPLRAPAVDVTFRAIAEDYAAQRDLIFLPVGRSHPTTGKPLFKVCKGVDGRRGVTVYVGEDAVFAQMEDGEFRAVSLEDMVKRASV